MVSGGSLSQRGRRSLIGASRWTGHDPRGDLHTGHKTQEPYAKVYLLRLVGPFTGRASLEERGPILTKMKGRIYSRSGHGGQILNLRGGQQRTSSSGSVQKGKQTRRLNLQSPARPRASDCHLVSSFRRFHAASHPVTPSSRRSSEGGTQCTHGSAKERGGCRGGPGFSPSSHPSSA